MEKSIVIKIGGATFGKRDPILEDIVALQKKGKSLVVIHGGGSMVTEWLKKQGSGYQTRINAILRSYMKAQSDGSTHRRM